MGTITKALGLLNHFSLNQPEIGLIQFVKLSGFDKATSHRLLSELAKNGFVEQDLLTRKYRLGPSVLRLANVREITFPARSVINPILEDLVAATGETAHASLLQSDILATIAHKEGTTHGTRVHIDPAELIPLHATASGWAVMAYAHEALTKQVLASNLKSWTNSTIVDRARLVNKIEDTRASGFGRSDQGFENGVYGIAAPLFDKNQTCIGAIAIATPTSRQSDRLDALIKEELAKASRRITHGWGGIIPTKMEDIWNRG